MVTLRSPVASLALHGSHIEVHVDVTRRSSELVLTVRDNGVGFPSDFSVERTTTMGLRSSRGLVEDQLGGTISMRSDNGAIVEVVIPVAHLADGLENL